MMLFIQYCNTFEIRVILRASKFLLSQDTHIRYTTARCHDNHKWHPSNLLSADMIAEVIERKTIERKKGMHFSYLSGDLDPSNMNQS